MSGIPKKVTQEFLNKIQDLRAVGYTQKSIAKQIGVSQVTISYHLKKLRDQHKIKSIIKSKSIIKDIEDI